MQDRKVSSAVFLSVIFLIIFTINFAIIFAQHNYLVQLEDDLRIAKAEIDLLKGKEKICQKDLIECKENVNFYKEAVEDIVKSQNDPELLCSKEILVLTRDIIEKGDEINGLVKIIKGQNLILGKQSRLLQHYQAEISFKNEFLKNCSEALALWKPVSY